jgi:hypothetical protein
VKANCGAHPNQSLLPFEHQREAEAGEPFALSGDFCFGKHQVVGNRGGRRHPTDRERARNKPVHDESIAAAPFLELRV